MNLPFIETPLGNNQYLREFEPNKDRDDIEEWHRDREDRIVRIIENQDWLFQFDNQLPRVLVPGETLHITNKTYHRIIKGKHKLVVEITKC